MRYVRLDKAQSGVKTAVGNMHNLRHTDDTTLMAESKEELKSILMNAEEESEKTGLNSAFKKLRSWHLVHHFMANIWGNSGNSVRFYFGGLQITADGDCSHEIKRHLLLGREVMNNLDSILKSRDIT